MWSWPRRESKCFKGSRYGGVELLKPFGIQWTILQAPDARHGAAIFGRCPDRFWFCFGATVSCYIPVLPFGEGSLYIFIYWKYLTCVCLFACLLCC